MYTHPRLRLARLHSVAPLLFCLATAASTLDAQGFRSSTPPPQTAQPAPPPAATRPQPPAPSGDGRNNAGEGAPRSERQPSVNVPFQGTPSNNPAQNGDGHPAQQQPAPRPPQQAPRPAPAAPRSAPSAPAQQPQVPRNNGNTGQAPNDRRDGRTGQPYQGQPAPGQPSNANQPRTNQPGPTGGAPSRPMPTSVRVVPTNNGTVTVRDNGRPMDVHDNRNNMVIHHNLVEGQRVVVNKQDGTRVAFERGRPGYVSRPYVTRGISFQQRTYFYNNQSYNRFYRPYFFHGYSLEIYTPFLYYSSGYYGWLNQPWRSRVRYRWGWEATPWYGFYGAYFQPYPFYVSPAFWLTDFLFSQSLSDYYATQQADGYSYPAYAGPAISPDVKQLVSNEVQGEIALDTAEASLNDQQQAPDPMSTSIAGIFADGQTHVFVAGREVDVVDLYGRECAVTDGDVVRLTVPPGPNDTFATVQVIASKGGADCRVNDNVNIALSDLQEMSNHMRETVDQGIQQLATQQGQAGLPPANTPVQSAPAFYAQNAPPPDPSVAQELSAEAQQAQNSDRQFTGQASGNATTTPATVSLSLGQSFSDVSSEMGAPTQVIQLGSKTIYVYPNTKVTFINGRVSDIQ